MYMYIYICRYRYMRIGVPVDTCVYIYHVALVNILIFCRRVHPSMNSILKFCLPLPLKPSL